MNIEKENALIHKIHSWVSLLLNILITSVFYVLDEGNPSKLIGTVIVLVLILLYSIIRISLDMQINDISRKSIVFNYICILLLSSLMIYSIYEKVSVVSMLIVLLLVVVEILVAIFLSYRYKIINMIRKHRKKRF